MLQPAPLPLRGLRRSQGRLQVNLRPRASASSRSRCLGFGSRDSATFAGVGGGWVVPEGNCSSLRGQFGSPSSRTARGSRDGTTVDRRQSSSRVRRTCDASAPRRAGASISYYSRASWLGTPARVGRHRQPCQPSDLGPRRRTVTRVAEGRVTRMPFASREVCANGHPWRTETTRWRVRGDGRMPERDCLVCKRVSEGNRKRRTMRDRRYL